ncbi:MAG: DUF4139 domain-containing protein [Calditrichaeota bacterium]|nr:DUF4139 domain-containing protein [Calditrichota bacterium]
MPDIFKRHSFKLVFLLLLAVSFVAGQQNTSITVTNQNIALVKEERQLDLNKGYQEIMLEDIPVQIIPASVLVESDFDVLEQNYEYDLISVDKMLEKSLEKEIIIEHAEQGKITGKLLSATASSLIIQNIDGITQVIPRNDEQKISLKGIAEEKQPFIIRPALKWDVEAAQNKKYDAMISYLSREMTWQADYVGLLNENDSQITLSGWVTVNNNCGKSFKQTKLKLMAGEINLEQPGRPQPRYETMMVAKATSAFQEKAFFEYHIYDMDRKTDLLNNQMKQIQLFGETTGKTTKIYRVNSDDAENVHVLISFENSKQNNLGMPLPAGTIRIYKKDGEEREFIGENHITHTPKDEKIDIEVGNAFDIVSERTVVDVKRPSNRSERRQVEYKIRNHKDSKIIVEIVESVPQNAEVTEHKSNGNHVRHTANALKYNVEVGANDEFLFNLTYTLSW